MPLSHNHVIFVDFSGKPTGGSIAAIAQDRTGRVQGIFQPLPICVSSSEGEFLALVLALQYALHRRWRRITIQSDSSEAVAAAQMEALPAKHVVAAYHSALRSLLEHFEDVRFERIAGRDNVAHVFAQAAVHGFTQLATTAALDLLLK